MAPPVTDVPTKELPFVPLTRPCISEEAINEVAECMRSGWVTTGPRCAKLEEQLVNYVCQREVTAESATRYAVTTNSCQSAMTAALKSFGVTTGDEVITTALTFAATFHAADVLGAIPVPVDARFDTYNIDPDLIEAAITKKTKAIVPVHFGGYPLDMDKIYDIARKHNLRVVEDCAHAIGTTYKGKRIGSIGDCQAFSFHANKNMTTGDGGCLMTGDVAVYDRTVEMRSRGLDRCAWNRYTEKGVLQYDVTTSSNKFNMPDLNASLGLHQLRRLDDNNAKRKAIVERYFEGLKEYPQLTMPPRNEGHCWHLFAPLVNEQQLGVYLTSFAGMNRNELMKVMRDKYKVGTGVHYEAPHLTSYYRKTYGFVSGTFPVAESIGSRTISLPLFPDLTLEQQNRVICALVDVFESSK